MNIMTKSIGAIAILGAFAGCAGDEGATPAATPPSAGQSRPPMGSPPAPKISDSAAKPDDGKMEAKPDDGKMEAKPSTAAPGKKDDAPKIEGPSKTDTKPSGAAAKLSEKELKGDQGTSGGRTGRRDRAGRLSCQSAQAGWDG